MATRRTAGAFLPVTAILVAHTALSRLVPAEAPPLAMSSQKVVRPSLYDYYNEEQVRGGDGCGAAVDKDRDSSCRVGGYATCVPDSDEYLGIPDEEWAVWRFSQVSGKPYRLDITWKAELNAFAPNTTDTGLDTNLEVEEENNADAEVRIEVSFDGGATLHEVYDARVLAGDSGVETSVAGRPIGTRSLSLLSVKSLDDVLVYVSAYAAAPDCDSGRAVAKGYIDLFNIEARVLASSSR